MADETVISDVEIPLVAGRRAQTRVEEGRRESSWLCASDADRARMLDMDERIAPVRVLTLAVLALTALSMSPWFGLWTLTPIAVAGVAFAVASRASTATDRPEYVLFGTWVLSELVIAATVMIAGLESNLLAWLAIPVVALSARFSGHGVLAGVAIALALCVGVGFAADAQAVIDYPPIVVGPAAVIIAVGILSTALMRSDFEHRGKAVIDQLTGMLNRNALARRAFELEQQSRLTGEPVGIVVGDLDSFKRINDSLGHAVGDAVLTQVAYTLRKQLRAFDLAYRLGGEEFLVLIPGADLEHARTIAEALRTSVESGTFEGQKMTMSFGVSATGQGQPFEYEPQFELADGALYEAKRAGRNRVLTAS
jgi:diguanylate cyclase (GGDEF)-like protein